MTEVIGIIAAFLLGWSLRHWYDLWRLRTWIKQHK